VPDTPAPVNGLPSTGPPGNARPSGGPSAVDLPHTVVVALGDCADTKAGDHALLAELVARLTGVDAASITLTQRCPRCGAGDHGPLRVSIAGSTSVAPWVSLARAGGRLALAVTAAGPVGIDLESLADLARAPITDVLLSPAETDALSALSPHVAQAAVAALWTTKEAILKVAGVGLRVDPRDLTVSLDGPATAPGPNATMARRRLVDWPQSPFPPTALHLLPVSSPPGTAATVAIVGACRPELYVMPARVG